MDFSQVTDVVIPEGNVVRIESGGVVLWSKQVYSEPFYIENRSTQQGTLTITSQNISGTPRITVQKSSDGSTWTSVGTTALGSSISTTVPAKGKLYLRCRTDGWCYTNDSSSFPEAYNYMQFDKQHNVGGNILSLLYGDTFAGQRTISQYNYSNFNFAGMFSGNYNLIDASRLLLPSAVKKNMCSLMFAGCSGLIAAPALPATALETWCYSQMFSGCSNLATAPALPALTLKNNCYENMFFGCSSLNYIKALFTTTPSSTYTCGWVDGVAASGTFVKNSAAGWSLSGINGIPSGWTVLSAS